MKLIFTILLGVVSTHLCLSQFVLEDSIVCESPSYFEIDQLGNVYVVEKDEIIKYSQKREVHYRESIKLFGDISVIDLNNSLRPLIFYQDQKQLVFLDNALSKREAPISLENHNLDQVSLVASSINNNNVWLYNQEDFQLLKADQGFRIIYESGNLAQLLMMELNPIQMLEHNNYLYINNPRIGILVFDMFGTYYKTIPIKWADYFHVIEDDIYFVTDEKRLYRYNVFTFEEQEIQIPVHQFESLKVAKDKIYILKNNIIKCYARH